MCPCCCGRGAHVCLWCCESAFAVCLPEYVLGVSPCVFLFARDLENWALGPGSVCPKRQRVLASFPRCG